MPSSPSLHHWRGAVFLDLGLRWPSRLVAPAAADCSICRDDSDNSVKAMIGFCVRYALSQRIFFLYVIVEQAPNEIKPL
jgi:hypothetical protein